MELVIDGYNLFKQIAGVDFISLTQLSFYINILVTYVQKKKLSALLIFDGGIHNYPTYDQKRLLKIMYVGKGKTADDAIKDFIESNHKRDLLLVSSDRELNRVADFYMIPSIDALDFWHFVQNSANERKVSSPSRGPIVKMSNVVNPELDDLMINTKMSIFKEDSIQQQQLRQSLKMSATDKKLLQKVKKL